MVVSSLDGHTGARQITLNGGGWRYQWSPDNKQIVFTDYDELGRFQVYVTKLDGNKRLQLSNFTDKDRMPFAFYWSDDGKFIRVEFVNFQYQMIDVLVFDTNSGQILMDIKDIDKAWWKESTIAYWKDNIITWISPLNGNIIKQITNAPKPYHLIQQFGSNEIFGCFWVCFGKENFGLLLYDIKDNVFLKFPNAVQILDITDWVALPDTYPGEMGCQDTG